MYKIKDLVNSEVANILTKEEEKKLIKKIKTSKDEKVKKKFLKLHRFLVASIITHYPNTRYSSLQLTKTGNKGLEKALEKYKLDYKFRFSAYAAWFIRAQIHKLLGLPEYPEKP